ncbi:unnamed protein product [Candidula unifasciata]|uniref:Uncharacterized protein n=1 Tax=Candidula unifasciata TaxID=100452 RepID=A0A8S3ZU61_9EUPU|nr:unnamed protein product [Candidula unifasciata]
MATEECPLKKDDIVMQKSCGRNKKKSWLMLLLQALVQKQVAVHVQVEAHPNKAVHLVQIHQIDQGSAHQGITTVLLTRLVFFISVSDNIGIPSGFVISVFLLPLYNLGGIFSGGIIG